MGRARRLPVVRWARQAERLEGVGFRRVGPGPFVLGGSLLVVEER